MVVVHPTFFAPVAQYVLLSKQEKILFEKHDNFQKQTYRNRAYIFGPNGRQLLTVPVEHSRGRGRLKTSDVRIDNSFQWQKIWVKSLESAYRSSPFYEYYEEELMQVFTKKYDYLIDLNLSAHEIICDCLGLEVIHGFTEDYQVEYNDQRDFRFLSDAKSQFDFDLESYTQVFDQRHGFISNLSILDLLCNEGTSSLDYLERQSDINPLN